MKHVWDLGLEFEPTKTELVTRLVKSREECKPDEEGGIDPYAPVRLAAYEAALTQCMNGCRASEAVDAFTQFIQGGNREPLVRVRKQSPRCTCGHSRTSPRETGGHEYVSKGVRGKCLAKNCNCEGYTPDANDVDMRPVFIPPEVEQGDLALFSKLRIGAGGFNENSYELFLLRNGPANSHSLRFCYITHLDDLGYTPTLICKITHHANVNEIITYLSKRKALKVQREVAGLTARSPEMKTA